MKSLATLLSLAVLIGVSTCMSLQEYEDDEVNKGDLGWWGIHFHFHFLDKPEPVTKPNCEGNKCKLCAHKVKYDVKIKDQGAVSAVTFPFDGCLIVTEENKQRRVYSFEFEMNDKHVYTNTFESFNHRVDVLPCFEDKKNVNAAQVCPELYNVNVTTGKFCAKIVQRLKLGDTYIEHSIDLGCSSF